MAKENQTNDNAKNAESPKTELPQTGLTQSDIAPIIGGLLLENAQLRKENGVLREVLAKKEQGI